MAPSAGTDTTTAVAPELAETSASPPLRASLAARLAATHPPDSANDRLIAEVAARLAAVQSQAAELSRSSSQLVGVADAESPAGRLDVAVPPAKTSSKG